MPYLILISSLSLSVLSYLMGLKHGRSSGYRDGYQDGRTVKFNNPQSSPKPQKPHTQRVKVCPKKELRDPVWMG
ncbi:hypothetical protein CMI47_08635 [Candidatus Pacearchaeota archaeon]|jgi:hypothetical protein|nr:hypothetical protein [Candidatus Pacearchaeota archaeon]|tara:strand:- start:140 stop:361 length:222 start_codon:yes stop_codon:yes gene_type:complete